VINELLIRECPSRLTLSDGERQTGGDAWNSVTASCRPQPKDGGCLADAAGAAELECLRVPP